MTEPVPVPVQALARQLRELRSLHASGVLGDAQYAESRAPLERRLIDHLLDGPPADNDATAPPAKAGTPTPAPRPAGRQWAAVGAFALVIAAAGYWWTGSPGQIGQPPPGFGGQAAAGAEQDITREQFVEMTSRLATRLKDKPDDAEGWSMLGRSYMALEQPADALAAYQRALELKPDDATRLADVADALAVKNDRKLDGEPTKLIERALALDPDNLKALTLAGTVAFNRGDYLKAVQSWERVATLGPPDSPMVQQARSAAAEARELGKVAAASASGAVPSTTPAAAPAAVAEVAVTGTVSLAPALKGKAAPDDTVFIFARPAEGARMPLAIVRKQVKDLPFTFRLDDSQAMSPATRLSGATRVIVGARISKSGQAMPRPGDLEGLSGAVAVGSTGVTVVIGEELK